MNQDLRDFEFNFIELKKFDKQEEELETIIEKWVHPQNLWETSGTGKPPSV
jgi:hypothetical protein